MNHTANGSDYIMPIRPMDIIILVSIWIGSVLGIFLNLFVMILTFSKEVRGTYMYYIFNLASLDFLSAITWAITGFYLTFYWYQSKSNQSLCYVQILGENFSITVTILALIPMSVHRRLAIDYGNHDWFQKVFGKFAIICYCSFAYIYGISMGAVRYINVETLPFIHAPDHRTWCNETLHSDELDNIQTNIERVFRYGSLAVVMFLVFSSYFRIRKHIGEMPENFQESAQESKNLAFAILMQAISSLIGHLPIAVFYLFYYYTPVFQETSPLITFYVIDIALIFNISNYILDPVMTLTIVKPYKRAFKKFRERIRGKFSKISPTAITTVAAAAVVGVGGKRV